MGQRAVEAYAWRMHSCEVGRVRLEKALFKPPVDIYGALNIDRLGIEVGEGIVDTGAFRLHNAYTVGSAAIAAAAPSVADLSNLTDPFACCNSERLCISVHLLVCLC